MTLGPEPVSVDPPPLAGPLLLRQWWCDLSFLHWAVEPDSVAHYFPPGVRPDVFDGRTYVGLVPFRMVGTGLPRGPGVPWVGTFLETNVRLYSVDSTGRRGVVFLSLDADRALVVAAARAIFGLPYRWARMRHHVRDDLHTYSATLRWPGTAAHSRIGVRAGGPAPVGPLEEFLTARWGLHVARFGRTWYLPNSHAVWSVRTAELVDFDDGLLASVGLGDLAGRAPDHVAFSDGVRSTFGRPGSALVPRR
jgi:uncharacterized protein YqjF (DUF2071 family)